MDNWQTLVKEKQFNDLLLEWNKKINLVSRRKADVFDLIEDSKLFFDAIDFKEVLNILDIGTGGGFPGIIIAIHHPGVNLTLIDSIQKKVNVVNDIVKKLELKNVKVICSRAEDLTRADFTLTEGGRSTTPRSRGLVEGREHQFAHHFDYVVARSVSVLQDLAKWSKDLLKPGGKLITVKGGDIDGEINKTKKLKYVKEVSVIEKNERKIVVVIF